MPSAPHVPLVVDADGTLLRGDMLHEALRMCVLRPRRWLGALRAAFRGRAALKQHLASWVRFAPGTLVWRAEVVQWLQAQRAAGVPLVLASASPMPWVQALADALGLFDEVLASTGTINLKGQAKREALQAKFGVQGYDYVGDSAADVPVWQGARRAWVVAASPQPLRRWQAHAPHLQALPQVAPVSWLAAAVAALRPVQWAKNLLMAAPLLAAHRYVEPGWLLPLVLGMASFSLVASAAYWINDWADVAHDRVHPTKRHRPLASGALPLWAPVLVVPGLLLLAAALAHGLPAAFQAALVVYAVATLAYSFGLKAVPLADGITLAALYTWRMVAGAWLVGVPMSYWFLLFAMFLFFSLAMAKRYSELRDMPPSQAEVPGRGYGADDGAMVLALGVASGMVAVLVLALYSRDPHTMALYRQPAVVAWAAPLLLYWVARVWRCAHRRQLQQDPVLFALRDRVSWLVGALVLGLVLWAR